MTFLRYKKQRKIKQMHALQGIIPYSLFVKEEQLRNFFFAVISLFIPRENSLSEGKTLDSENFYKIIKQSKFLFAALSRLCC